MKLAKLHPALPWMNSMRLACFPDSDRPALVLVAVVVMALAGCGGGGGGNNTPSFTVTASAGSGGSLTPASASVTQGNTTSFTVTPNSGFSIASVAGCNGSLNGSTYTTGPVTANCTVNASFSAVPSFTVTATAGSGGSLTPPSASVTQGNTTSFTVTPNSGFSIANVTGCNGTLNGTTYTTGPVTANCTVNASFVATSDSSGLDSRPSNTSCIAPERPTVAASYRLERVFSNLNLSDPLYMGQPPGDASRWFVAQKTGQILSFQNTPGVSVTTPFLTLPIVIGQGETETGLLGFAFAPDFATSGRAYVSYTRAPGNGLPLQSVVSRFTSADGGQTLNPASEQEILVIDQPSPIHNGGGIAFGPDGFLYLGMGDGGTSSNSQNTRNLLGTFIRINVAGGGVGYSIPAGNPFSANPPCVRGIGAAPCPEIFAWGVRNPWRWSFDRSTGELWAGDVGGSLREEVSIIEAGGNYGWPVREGFLCVNPGNCNSADMIDPVADYEHGGGAAIIGGYVYRGQLMAELRGRYVFGDAYRSVIWALAADGDGRYSIETLVPNSGAFIPIGSFAESLDGEFFAVALGASGGGRLYQLLPGGTAGVNTIPDLLSATGCVNPGNPTQPASGLIPYSPGAPFWSDNAAKTRWLALPNGTSISVDQAGDFQFPPGSILVKNFARQSTLIETRLFMRHPDGIWAGYTYRWNGAQTEATRVVGGAILPAGGGDWIYPSETQCLQCHTEAAGRALGPEIVQLNNAILYPQTGRIANQLATLDHISLLSPPLAAEPSQLPDMPDPFGSAPRGTRARAYLHTNCAGCHRPGSPLQSTMDLRYTTPLAQTNACDVDSINGTSLGIANAKLIARGDASRSLVVNRMSRRDAYAMPPIGSLSVDSAGAELIRAWIDGLGSCD